LLQTHETPYIPLAMPLTDAQAKLYNLEAIIKL